MLAVIPINSFWVFIQNKLNVKWIQKENSERVISTLRFFINDIMHYFSHQSPQGLTEFLAIKLQNN